MLMLLLSCVTAVTAMNGDAKARTDRSKDEKKWKRKTGILSAAPADLTLPHENYPLARSIRRKVILHSGPTNSGKTHKALERLKKARTGCYGGLAVLPSRAI